MCTVQVREEGDVMEEKNGKGREERKVPEGEMERQRKDGEVEHFSEAPGMERDYEKEVNW